MTDLIILASLLALAAAPGWALGRRYANHRIDAARTAGYKQALQDTADDREAEDAEIAAAMQGVYENRDWLRGRVGQLEEARGRAEEDTKKLRAELAKYVGKEPTIAEEMAYVTSERDRLEAEVTHLKAALAAVQGGADYAAYKRLANDLTDRLDSAQAALEACDVPGDLIGAVTPEQWRGLVVDAAEPIRERLGQDAQLRRLRAEGRFAQAAKYAQALPADTARVKAVQP